ncbi:MAG: glucoamylase family protein [Oscillospiraceae bacterium]
MTYDGTMPQIDDSGLPQYGENIARTLNITGFVRGASVSKTLYKNIRFLHEHHTALELKYPGGEAVPPYIEWLLDNFYLAHREGLSSAAELYSCGRVPAARGTAAIFALCEALIRSGDGKVTPERCELFLQGCQQTYVLSRRELTHFVPALKAAAISELTELYSTDIDEGYAARAAEKLFSTLRTLSTLDFSEILENVDKTEQILKQDPAGVYPGMSEKTRIHYKKRIEKLSKAYHVGEHHIAQQVLGLAQNAEGTSRHVGYWLFTRPMNENKISRTGELYITSLMLLTLILALAAAFALKSAAVGLLIIIPLSELIKTVVDYIILRFTPPAHVPRMELENGIPPLGRTICVISALLTSEKSGAVLGRRLEEFRFAGRDCGENLLFGILADLPDSKDKISPEDEKYISAAKNAVDELNEKYGGGFFFFVRERIFNKADNCYSAWERKRGAITELARFLCDDNSSLQALSGNYLALRGVRYIMTLDEDTRLTPGTAKELIGAMLHPLNAPVIDERTKKVTSGHAVIHPRISVELFSCNRSKFSKIFAGHGGTDPYGSDSSELYMDVFDNGGFAGKGIIDAAAFTECLRGRIPDNRVLSHDALEGAFLRGAYMGDAELTDKFPSDMLAYYKRLNRWTRGDWQNLPWLFRRGRHLSSIDRFRLLDSARRSLVAPLVFICFTAAFFSPSRELGTAALIALFCYAFRLVTTAVRDLFRDESELKLRFHSSVIHGLGGAFLQTGLKLIFLPYDAYVCFTATVTALWRMLVSHRGLLRWTPASMFEGKSQGAWKYFRNMWFSPFAGLIFVFLAPSIIGKASGLVWFLSPYFAFSLSKVIVRQSPLSDADKSYLLSCAKSIWRFFEDFCTAGDHYLPPDNWQERPPLGIAHRTSPTNIGLCLLSCISAIDLGLAREQTAFGIIQNILATLRRMPKWNGHLYNWYDTRTLRSLHPAYVSTVDSGNLMVSLIILREALKEYDRPELAAECDELITPMSFVPLYDKAHRLFSIGIDIDRHVVTNSFYDLMASEARTTGFVAIARGDVSRRHWRNLSRAQVEKNGYRGMVSWTGSMFEYMMPHLFFESAEGSLMYESMRFAVEVQKKRGKNKNLPWGISESAFYALDPALNYRYKAHGCGALALKRNMNSEYVVSPYSSFLSLCCGIKSAVSNLRRLEKLDAVGKYGFWEAVDFTSGRTVGNCGEIVYCVMAHHLGMSLVSITNALRGNIMPHRLMRDPSMSSHACLLDEKLPLGGVLLRRKESKLPEKPPRALSVYWDKRGGFVDFEAPSCCVLSNGEYNIMLTDGGVSKSRWGNITPYFTSNEIPAFSHGVELFLKREHSLTPLLPSPEMSSASSSDWEFSLSGAKIGTVQGDLRSQVNFSVSASSNGEKRVISLTTENPEEQNCELCLLFEPVLAEYSDYVNHPAFYKLGLHAKAHGGALIIRRLERENIPECFLCLACSVPMEFSARRTLVPGRGGLSPAIETFVPSALGWLNDPLICAKLPLRIAKESAATVTVTIAMGESENEAYASAMRMLTGGEDDTADFPAERAS